MYGRKVPIWKIYRKISKTQYAVDVTVSSSRKVKSQYYRRTQDSGFTKLLLHPDQYEDDPQRYHRYPRQRRIYLRWVASFVAARMIL